jgi:hypothetical protein
MSAAAEPALMSWDEWDEWEEVERVDVRELRRESRELAARVGVACCGTCSMDEECEVFQVARERNRTLARNRNTKH